LSSEPFALLPVHASRLMDRQKKMMHTLSHDYAEVPLRQAIY